MVGEECSAGRASEILRDAEELEQCLCKVREDSFTKPVGYMLEFGDNVQNIVEFLISLIRRIEEEHINTGEIRIELSNILEALPSVGAHSQVSDAAWLKVLDDSEKLLKSIVLALKLVETMYASQNTGQASGRFAVSTRGHNTTLADDFLRDLLELRPHGPDLEYIEHILQTAQDVVSIGSETAYAGSKRGMDFEVLDDEVFGFNPEEELSAKRCSSRRN